MRPVQEMNMEFVNALNAAESECAKLRRMLEEEQKLVQRLEQEKEDEVQMANIKIERMSQQLAEARKDVEFATVRADVAENEWIKVKRELLEALVLVQLLKLENEKKRQSTLKQVEEKELELANALNAAAISESECDKLRTMLEKEQKLVQRHKLEKDDEAQLDKRRIEEISQELVEVQKNAKYETTRADLAENEWIKTKRELQKERELLQLLKPEYDVIRQSAMRQVEEKELELANLLNALEIAEIEWIKVKKELQEKVEHVQFLKQACQETRQSAMRQVEEEELEFADALNALNAAATAASSSAAAEGECAKLKRILIEEGKTVQRLILEKDLLAKLAQRQIEETGQELAIVLNATTTTESSSTAKVFIQKLNWMKRLFYLAQAHLCLVPRDLLLRVRLQLLLRGSQLHLDHLHHLLYLGQVERQLFLQGVQCYHLVHWQMSIQHPTLVALTVVRCLVCLDFPVGRTSLLLAFPLEYQVALSLLLVVHPYMYHPLLQLHQPLPHPRLHHPLLLLHHLLARPCLHHQLLLLHHPLAHPRLHHRLLVLHQPLAHPCLHRPLVLRQ